MNFRERVIHVPVVLPGAGIGGRFGVVGAMFALFGAVVGFAVVVLLMVLRLFPSTEYATVPTSSVPATTAVAPVGSEQR